MATALDRLLAAAAPDYARELAGGGAEEGRKAALARRRQRLVAAQAAQDGETASVVGSDLGSVRSGRSAVSPANTALREAVEQSDLGRTGLLDRFAALYAALVSQRERAPDQLLEAGAPSHLLEAENRERREKERLQNQEIKMLSDLRATLLEKEQTVTTLKRQLAETKKENLEKD